MVIYFLYTVIFLEKQTQILKTKMGVAREYDEIGSCIVSIKFKIQSPTSSLSCQLNQLILRAYVSFLKQKNYIDS